MIFYSFLDHNCKHKPYTTEIYTDLLDGKTKMVEEVKLPNGSVGRVGRYIRYCPFCGESFVKEGLNENS